MFNISWPYQIGEVIQISIENSIRQAKVISKSSRVPESWGGDAGEENMVTLQFLDTQEVITDTEHSLTWGGSTPLFTMMELSERLMSMVVNPALSEKEASIIREAMTVVDRLTAESASHNMELFGITKEQGLCVVLEEEYGYRSWLWFPEMDQSALVEWWKAQESVGLHFFDPSKTLPGKIVAMETVEQKMIWTVLNNGGKLPYAHIHTDGDSFLRTGDENYQHKGYDEHYFDSKPCDTVAKTDDKGNVISMDVRKENPCSECLSFDVCKRDNKI